MLDRVPGAAAAGADPSARQPGSLTIAYTLVTLLTLRDQQSAGWAEGYHRGLPPLYVVLLSS